MKEFHELLPVVVIGGVAGAFLGEYMAGGILIVLGLDNSEKLPIVGPHCATGMHGGRIFIRGEVPQENISEHITAVKELDSAIRKSFKDMCALTVKSSARALMKLCPCRSQSLFPLLRVRMQISTHPTDKTYAKFISAPHNAQLCAALFLSA